MVTLQETQPSPEPEKSSDPPPVHADSAGNVRQPKFEPTANSGAAENPSDYVTKGELPVSLLHLIVANAAVGCTGVRHPCVAIICDLRFQHPKEKNTLARRFGGNTVSHDCPAALLVATP